MRATCPTYPTAAFSSNTSWRGETATEFVERARRLAAIGVDHLVVITQGPWTATTLAVLAEAIPAIDDIETHLPDIEDISTDPARRPARQPARQLATQGATT